MKKLVKQMSVGFEHIIDKTKQVLENESRLKAAELRLKAAIDSEK